MSLRGPRKNPFGEAIKDILGDARKKFFGGPRNKPSGKQESRKEDIMTT